MPEEKKGAAGAKRPSGEGKEDRRRMTYLKIRGRELKKETQAVREEMEALRQKLGMGGPRPKMANKAKGKGKRAAAADDDD